MAYGWFRVDSDVVDHPKVIRLASELQEPLAGWYVIRFWAWLEKYAPRGIIDPASVRVTDLEAMVFGWRGEPNRLWSALLTARLVEQLPDGTFEAHDWWEKQGPLVEKANKDAARQRRRRRRMSRGRTADGNADVSAEILRTRRDETRRDETNTPGTPSPAATSVEVDVFEHWKKAANHPQAQFTGDRKRKVKARLADGYTVEQLKKAVDGCLKTPHNLGQNDRGERYDDLELICRDGSHVDRFMRNAESPPSAKQGRLGESDWERVGQEDRAF